LQEIKLTPVVCGDGFPRCPWALSGQAMTVYHDIEWGVPVNDDKKLFEFLILEGAQAGLSWSTVLSKRGNYRKAYDFFDPEKIASYGEEKISMLLSDPGIIRNRRKIESSVTNAQAFLDICQSRGNFSEYIWEFTGGKTIINHPVKMTDIPCSSKESVNMSRDLIQRGFNFTGPTICYAFMQAVGMVNDHLTGCYRFMELSET
jgi:DNA-3-methyladenine glycosylase I